ncbi:MAG: hypothetical protein WDW36_001642 [Sanguina aurantia]
MATAAKIERVPHAELTISRPVWWLESRFHFSFAGTMYQDPKRNSFGALRVINDDLVKGRAGFGAHPHRDAEIFTYVVDGKLSHRDSMGNQEALARGSIQYLSAGRGIRHSEMNDEDSTTRFLQVWLTPEEKGVTPQYGSSEYGAEQRRNKLLQVLGGTGQGLQDWSNLDSPNQIKLHQDANVIVSESDAGVAHTTPLAARRQAYIVCIEGSLKLNDVQLDMRDGARVIGSDTVTTPLVVTAGPGGAHFMMIEMVKA